MTEMDTLYPIVGNPLNKSRWHVYNRPYSEYIVDADVLNEPRVRKAFERLATLRRPVMLDLCAPTHTLQDFYNSTSVQSFKAAAVSVQEDPSKQVNEKIGLTNIIANLAAPDYIQKLERWLGRDMLDFTTAFPVGAFYNLNNTWNFYFEITQWLLTHTNPDQGAILLETPPPAVFAERNMPIDRWLQFLAGNNIYVNYLSSHYASDTSSSGLLFLQRTPASAGLRCAK